MEPSRPARVYRHTSPEPPLRWLSAFFALLCLLYSHPALAGNLQGEVLDDGGLSIPGVLLTLSGATLIGGSQQRTSDDAGRFQFVELPAGTYELKAEKQGFSPVRKTGLEVADGRTTAVTLELRYGGQEVIVVESRRFTPEFLSRIPSGRDYQDVVGQTAGVIGGGGNPASGGAASNDNYAFIDDNVFVSVADDPMSTFSIDVDTASYSNVRRFLADGQRPPTDAVRIEELLNYFEYDYPDAGEPIHADVVVTEAPWAPDHRIVRIGLVAPAAPEAETPPRNLVFLVDVSGSMATPDRLPLVQRGLSLLTQQLGADDHVALVVYAGAAGVVLPPTRGDRHAVIEDAIARLGAGGSTAGAAGIRAAYDLAAANFQDGAINRVILATDGDFNVGVSSESELVRLIEERRQSGVFLTVLGVGRGNLQDAKMELLADRGNGNYAYIDTFAELQKVLLEQVGRTLTIAAKDVKLQVEFNPLEVARYRLIGYENRALAHRDFADDTKDAGDMGAGHTVTALYEVVPASVDARDVRKARYFLDRPLAPAARSGELLTVHLRYKRPNAATSTERSYPIHDAGGTFADASADTRWAGVVAGFGMLLRDSPDRGQVDWEWLRTTARDALGPDTQGYRAEFLGMIERARRLPGAAAAR